MALIEYPDWLRAFDVIVGIISIIVGIWIILNPALGQITILFFVSFALAFLGFNRIIKGVTLTDTNQYSRILNTLGGFIAVILSLFVYIFSYLTILFLVILISLSLASLGFSRIIYGFIESDVDGWWRGMQIIIGIINIILGGIIWFYPFFGWLLVIMLLGVILITNGATRVISTIANIKR